MVAIFFVPPGATTLSDRHGWNNVCMNRSLLKQANDYIQLMKLLQLNNNNDISMQMNEQIG